VKKSRVGIAIRAFIKPTKIKICELIKVEVKNYSSKKYSLYNNYMGTAIRIMNLNYIIHHNYFFRRVHRLIINKNLPLFQWSLFVQSYIVYYHLNNFLLIDCNAPSSPTMLATFISYKLKTV